MLTYPEKNLLSVNGKDDYYFVIDYIIICVSLVYAFLLAKHLNIVVL